jgi:hypothetical protein
MQGLDEYAVGQRELLDYTLHAKYTRKRLEASDPVQERKWSEHYNSLREWIQSCEKVVGELWGIDVEQVVFNYATQSALSICIKRFPDSSDFINT